VTKRTKYLGASGVGVTLVTLAVLVGAAGGVGSFTFLYADGGSYLSNDATACANCHVMQSHFDAWVKSTHKDVATCNDCHAPHGSLPGKLWVKGKNGFNHSLAFTTGRFPEPVQITPANRRVTEAACRHCHQQIVHAIDTGPRSGESLSCIRCHREVGHAN
jgi:cytochrome c nitrite reductase small subunit